MQLIVVIRVMAGIGLVAGLIAFFNEMPTAQGYSVDSLPWGGIIVLIIWNTACLWGLMGPINLGAKKKSRKPKTIDSTSTPAYPEASIANELANVQVDFVEEEVADSVEVQIFRWRIVGKNKFGDVVDGELEETSMTQAVSKAEGRGITVEKIERA